MKKLFTILFSIFFLTACSNKKHEKVFFEHKGFSAGTSFLIEYDKNAGNLNTEIDNIFTEIEKSLLFSDSSSLISRINRNDSIGQLDEHFLNVFNLSKRIFLETNGAFDPTIYPLSQFWGADDAKFKTQDKSDKTNEGLTIDSLRRFVGFGKYNLNAQTNDSSGQGNQLVHKINNGTLNFNQIYEGYMVDKVAELLNAYNVSNYRIEIGGKIKAKGLNQKLKSWEIGIDEAVDNPKSRQLLAIAKLNNEGYAIAGSYRKYYTKNEMKFSYCINPLTGYPVNHTLVSVSVFAPSCAEAEAYAAAFLVMGLEKTKIFVNAHPQIQVYLISNNYKGEWITFISNRLKDKLEFVKEERPL